MTQKLKLKLKLVAQGENITMVNAGECPVLLATTEEELFCAVVYAVNFLRAAAPAVQITTKELSLRGSNGVCGVGVPEKVRNDLAMLGRGGEVFSLADKRRFAYENKTLGDDVFLTITRHVNPE